MLHRHPFLSVLTLGYLGFVGWMTLTPSSAGSTPFWVPLAMRVLDKLHAHQLFLWLDYDRLEFLANIGLFVPVGMFLLLLFGARLWWVAAASGWLLTMAIETAQRDIPGRVSDPRDVVANTLGTVAGILLALILTWPARRRHRRRIRARRARELVAASRAGDLG